MRFGLRKPVKRSTSRSGTERDNASHRGIHHRRLRCEQLEERTLLSIGGARFDENLSLWRLRDDSGAFADSMTTIGGEIRPAVAIAEIDFASGNDPVSLEPSQISFEGPHSISDPASLEPLQTSFEGPIPVGDLSESMSMPDPVQIENRILLSTDYSENEIMSPPNLEGTLAADGSSTMTTVVARTPETEGFFDTSDEQSDGVMIVTVDPSQDLLADSAEQQMTSPLIRLFDFS